MRVRVIRLANNFYKDEEQKKRNAGGLSDNPNRRLGEYCCLGYFDALDVQLVEEDEG